MLRRSLWLLIVGFILTLCACGLKGNLYLPEKSTPVITTSPSQASSSSASNSPQP